MGRHPQCTLFIYISLCTIKTNDVINQLINGLSLQIVYWRWPLKCWPTIVSAPRCRVDSTANHCWSKGATVMRHRKTREVSGEEQLAGDIYCSLPYVCMPFSRQLLVCQRYVGLSALTWSSFQQNSNLVRVWRILSSTKGRSWWVRTKQTHIKSRCCPRGQAEGTMPWQSILNSSSDPTKQIKAIFKGQLQTP